MREVYFGNLAAELVDEQVRVAWVSEHLCSYDISTAGLQWITRIDTVREAKLIALVYGTYGLIDSRRSDT